MIENEAKVTLPLKYYYQLSRVKNDTEKYISEKIRKAEARIQNETNHVINNQMKAINKLKENLRCLKGRNIIQRIFRKGEEK